MGKGFSYKCGNCGKEYQAFYGIGFLFPQTYEKIMKKAKTGKYGQEWKELSRSKEYVVIDAEDHVYVCGKCNHWSVEPGLSLYEPKDVDTLREKPYGEKTVEEWGEVPYVMASDLQEDYQLLKRRVHKCSKCGSVMHKATKVDLLQLRCPHCGGEPEGDMPDNAIMWD